ncbi:hypothetical protein HU200_048785 [Digitaria exilis]|uniref:F-box domain-containing protein n=1 Tax=Digitaria exilis TaxID=1010633 RepID=A0A835AUN3_9POAL|nr:hypothetical protein HU200_048785 [Digitaria exilis]CAB3504268.1 unnamed protein product [Digitaria exilis]
MAGTTSPPPSWSDIPLELVGLILRRLPALADRARFAAVCRQWRRAAREVPLPAPLPLLALPDGTVYSLPGSKPFRFPGCVGYVDACGDWLAFSGENGYFLKNPFSHATVALPQKFRVQDHRRRHAGDETGVRWMEMEDHSNRLTMYKLLYCSPQLVAAFIRIERSTRLAVCQPGAGSRWSVHIGWMFSLSVDMAFHQGKLYVLEESMETLFSIDISVDHGTCDPWVSRVRYVLSEIPSAIPVARNENVTVKILYLVELDGALLMVRRTMHCIFLPGMSIANLIGGNEFKLFRVDFQQSKWVEVTTIGDNQVLFLRRRCSRFIPVSLEEMPGDRIIFLDNDDEDHSWYKVVTSDSCSVYDMRDGKVSAFPPMVSWEQGPVPATWLFPQG